MTATLTAPGDCPKCEARGFANPGELAAHLIDAHDMAGLAALAMARQAAGEVRQAPQSGSTNGKETNMAPNSKANVTCRACGATGHTARSRECPTRVAPHRSAPSEHPGRRAKKTTGTCGYCKRERPDHTENCRLGGTAGPTPRPAKKHAPITRRHPKPPKKAGAKTDTILVSELEALTVIVQALTSIEAFEGKRNVLLCACKLLAIDPTKLAA